MSNAPKNSILCDDATRRRSTTEIIYNALQPIRVKGKALLFNALNSFRIDFE